MTPPRTERKPPPTRHEYQDERLPGAEWTTS